MDNGDIEHIFSVRNNGYDRYGAIVVYPFKNTWDKRKLALSVDEVMRVARALGQRRELSTKVDVVDLIFNKTLQIYVATYGHVDKSNGGKNTL